MVATYNKLVSGRLPVKSGGYDGAVTLSTAPGRGRDREATRRRILTSAVELFAQDGFDQVTVRAVAAAAGVNVALINRYFGSKQGLFDAVLGAAKEPLNLADLTLDELPRRLAEYAARTRQAQIEGVPVALSRSSASPEVRELVRRRIEQTLIEPLAERLDGPDARARAVLCAAVVVGTGSVRQLLGLSDAPTADQLEPVLRTCLAGR